MPELHRNRGPRRRGERGREVHPERPELRRTLVAIDMINASRCIPGIAERYLSLSCRHSMSCDEE